MGIIFMIIFQIFFIIVEVIIKDKGGEVNDGLKSQDKKRKNKEQNIWRPVMSTELFSAGCFILVSAFL
ncbi:MAG: hypothetical protein ABII88_00825 [Candidatus Omnitrophota bacterium]